MNRELRSLVRSWGELGQKIGFFLLLILGSAAVGAAIAWPLWYFATSARRAYTAFALILAAAGVVFLIVRAILRARGAPRETAGPRRSALSGFLALVQAIVLLAGLYLAAVLFFHGVWIFAVPLVLVCAALLVLLGLARRAAKASRPRSILPKIRKE